MVLLNRFAIVACLVALGSATDGVSPQRTYMLRADPDHSSALVRNLGFLMADGTFRINMTEGEGSESYGGLFKGVLGESKSEDMLATHFDVGRVPGCYGLVSEQEWKDSNHKMENAWRDIVPNDGFVFESGPGSEWRNQLLPSLSTFALNPPPPYPSIRAGFYESTRQRTRSLAVGSGQPPKIDPNLDLYVLVLGPLENKLDVVVTRHTKCRVLGAKFEQEVVDTDFGRSTRYWVGEIQVERPGTDDFGLYYDGDRIDRKISLQWVACRRKKAEEKGSGWWNSWVWDAVEELDDGEEHVTVYDLVMKPSEPIIGHTVERCSEPFRLEVIFTSSD
ncbi:hypothetical protein BJ508DRAFT_309333 [Ascobolus immersus RN42]|uniref:Uncharacterized protein n=1 Tax=Ascobolus immersus RN42 TaxID=1160509 RepID=A0A3N4HZ72_ASCIM|nr:hypothetical protein BJ508DRAFT_309333 [Ascobolus immersus RN42]